METFLSGHAGFPILFVGFKRDMDCLAGALQIPAIYICSQETIATRMEALMILLHIQTDGAILNPCLEEGSQS